MFVSIIKVEGQVTSSTTARWLKEVKTAAGIDTSTFKVHCVRASTASMQCATIQDIQSAGVQRLHSKGFITNQYKILCLPNQY